MSANRIEGNEDEELWFSHASVALRGYLDRPSDSVSTQEGPSCVCPRDLDLKSSQAAGIGYYIPTHPSLPLDHGGSDLLRQPSAEHNQHVPEPEALSPYAENSSLAAPGGMSFGFSSVAISRDLPPFFAVHAYSIPSNVANALPKYAVKVAKCFHQDDQRPDTPEPSVTWNGTIISGSMVTDEDARKLQQAMLEAGVLSFDYRVNKKGTWLTHLPDSAHQLPSPSRPEKQSEGIWRFVTEIAEHIALATGWQCRTLAKAGWRGLMGDEKRFNPKFNTEKDIKHKGTTSTLRRLANEQGRSIAALESCTLEFEQPDGTLTLVSQNPTPLTSSTVHSQIQHDTFSGRHKRPLSPEPQEQPRRHSHLSAPSSSDVSRWRGSIPTAGYILQPPSRPSAVSPDNVESHASAACLSQNCSAPPFPPKHYGRQSSGASANLPRAGVESQEPAPNLNSFDHPWSE